MTISVSQLRQGLAETIMAGTSSPLYAYAFVEENINLPAAVIEPADADFLVAMNRGTDVFDFNIFVLVARTDPVSAQAVLDNFISGDGPDSIRRAVYDREDLGLGDDVAATLHGFKGYGGSLEGYGIPHIGAVLQVRIKVDN